MKEKQNKYILQIMKMNMLFIIKMMQQHLMEKKAEISSKGILNNKISTIIFEMLKENNINTHFIKSLSDREMLVKK